MAETPGEGEKSLHDLLKLPPSNEGAESDCQHGYDTKTQFDAVEKANANIRKG
jgi:hypothetical protein